MSNSLHRAGRRRRLRPFFDSFRSKSARWRHRRPSPIGSRYRRKVRSLPSRPRALPRPCSIWAPSCNRRMPRTRRSFARWSLIPSLDIARLLLGNMMQQAERCGDAIDMYRSIPSESIYRWSAEISVADCQQSLRMSTRHRHAEGAGAMARSGARRSSSSAISIAARSALPRRSMPTTRDRRHQAGHAGRLVTLIMRAASRMSATSNGTRPSPTSRRRSNCRTSPMSSTTSLMFRLNGVKTSTRR